MVDFPGPGFIVAAILWIGAHHQQILGGREPAVTNTRRMNNHVAFAQLDDAAFFAAKTNAGMATSDAQYFVGPRVKVVVRIDSVAPCRLPSIGSEENLENSGRVGSACSNDGTRREH